MTDHAHAHAGVHRDDDAKKMGMWLFLFTELLLFGGLFLVYSIYRFMNADDFANGAHHLDVFVGTLNTIVLITSSLTIALSITAIQKGQKKLALGLCFGFLSKQILRMGP
jgi:cytochrome c oxidase subunit 3